MADSGNENTIAQFLLSNGFNADEAAAFLGNWQVESNFSPTAYNAKEGAIGIAQWEGGRRQALDAFAAAQGTSETDLTTQLEFFLKEIRGNYSGSTLGPLQRTTDPATAAQIVQANYEGSSPASLPQRQADAVNIAAQLRSLSAGSPALLTAAVTGNGGSGGLGGTLGNIANSITGLGGIVGGSSAVGSLSSLLPWNWGSDVTSAEKGVVSGVGSILLRLAIVGTGLALVVVGGYKAVLEPANQTVNTEVQEKTGPAAGAAAQAAPLAAAAL